MTRVQPPRRLAVRLVETAARIVPPRHRERYERELTAELYDVPPREQLAHAVRVLGHAWSLRTALAAQPVPTGGPVMAARPRRPLLCRLNLMHHWKTMSTEDGGRYRACTRCGKQQYPPAPANIVM